MFTHLHSAGAEDGPGKAKLLIKVAPALEVLAGQDEPCLSLQFTLVQGSNPKVFPASPTDCTTDLHTPRAAARTSAAVSTRPASVGAERVSQGPTPSSASGMSISDRWSKVVRGSDAMATGDAYRGRPGSAVSVMSTDTAGLRWSKQQPSHEPPYGHHTAPAATVSPRGMSNRSSAPAIFAVANAPCSPPMAAVIPGGARDRGPTSPLEGHPESGLENVRH